MNYIREELLRQREVLAALMSGGEQDMAEERGEERPDLTWEEREAFRTYGDAAGSGGRSSRSVSQTAEEIPLFEAAVFESGRPMIPQGAASYEYGSERMGLVGQVVFAGGGAAEASLNVKNVSRSIQRDARRYDGGFSMY